MVVPDLDCTLESASLTARGSFLRYLDIAPDAASIKLDIVILKKGSWAARRWFAKFPLANRLCRSQGGSRSSRRRASGG